MQGPSPSVSILVGSNGFVVPKTRTRGDSTDLTGTFSPERDESREVPSMDEETEDGSGLRVETGPNPLSFPRVRSQRKRLTSSRTVSTVTLGPFT